MNTKWVGAALLNNKTIIQQLAVQLRQAHTINAVYNLVKVHLHDHNTGLPRGQATAKLHLAKDGEKDADVTKEDKVESAQKQKEEHWRCGGSGILMQYQKEAKKAKEKATVHVGVVVSGGTLAESVLNWLGNRKVL